MGVRGIDELLAALPPVAVGPAAAVVQGLAELLAGRHAPLGPGEVRALAEFWERASAQVAAGRLAVFAAMDDRDDVVSKAPVGQASAVYAQHALGQRRSTSRRDGEWARLLRPDAGDLPLVGAGYAAGDLSTGHVEVAVRAHRQLNPTVRDELVDCEQLGDLAAGDNHAPAEPDMADVDLGAPLTAALSQLSDGFSRQLRLIRVVDVILAHYARVFTVTELDALAKRIVANLGRTPPPDGMHLRRYLTLKPRPGGGWIG